MYMCRLATLIRLVVGKPRAINTVSICLAYPYKNSVCKPMLGIPELEHDIDIVEAIMST